MGAAVRALSKWHLRCNAGVDTIYIRYGRTRTEEAARRTRTGEKDQGGRADGAGEHGRRAAERGEGGRRCVSARATLKSKHSSGGSIAVEVGCVPEGLGRSVGAHKIVRLALSARVREV